MDTLRTLQSNPALASPHSRFFLSTFFFSWRT